MPVAFKMPAPAVAWSSISFATLEPILHCASFFPSIFQMQVFKRGSYGLNLLMCLGPSFQASYWLSRGGSRAHRRDFPSQGRVCQGVLSQLHLGHRPQRNERKDSKEYLYTHVQRSMIHNSKGRSNSDVCQGRLLNRQMVVYLYNGQYSALKKGGNSDTGYNMDKGPDNIMLSEIKLDIGQIIFVNDFTHMRFWNSQYKKRQKVEWKLPRGWEGRGNEGYF